MSERRTVLSRPRTKVYDCNYNIGEGYYKPTLDRLDRKYSGKPLLEEMQTKHRPMSVDFDSVFEGRANRQNGLQAQEDDFSGMESTIKKIRQNKNARAASLEDELNSFTSRSEMNKRRTNLSDRVLDSVGLNGKAQQALEDDVFFKRKTFRRVEAEEEEPNTPIAKWTAMKLGDDGEERAAKERARRSKVRLADLDAEMEELAERGMAREKRLSGLRALVADNEANGNSCMRKTVSLKSEKKTVTF